MGDQEQRHVALPLEPEQQLDDLAAGVLVEIAGGLVGEQQLGVVAERPGERRALLLAAQLAGVVVGARGEADLGEALAGLGEGIAGARQLERHGDVLERGHGRDEVERLEQNTDLTATEQREAVLVELAQRLAFDPHHARGRALDAADHGEQGDLPEPEGPTTLTELPAATVRSMPRRILTDPPCSAGSRARR